MSPTTVSPEELEDHSSDPMDKLKEALKLGSAPVNGVNESMLPLMSGTNKILHGYQSDYSNHSLNGLKGMSDGSTLEPSSNGTIPGGPEPIAIVGMAMRLPGGVNSGDSFWNLLINKRDGRCRVPSDRYNVDSFYSPERKPGTVNSHHGYFLKDDLKNIDAAFFSMIRNELDMVDPQQRQILEVVRECLENAGETSWRGKNIGCYIGVYGEDWLDMGAKDTQSLGLYRITGAGDFVIANRVSYEYDFRGPSMVIRTACSSSLLGLHMACQALYNGECSSAIVGGTNLILSPTMTIAMTEQAVLSPTGSCKTFDADADGYARGEAINTIYVKKLSDAIKNGDPIRAVIKATAANADGKTPGIPSPSSEAHEALMRRAYEYAGIRDFSKTGFVECHGTGTQTGDPLEAGAVARVFGRDGVYIGSVKPNVGHSEGASGLTSVIKAALALEHKVIPPQVHFSKGNPKIPFAEARLKVPVDPVSWPKDRCERASVNSFGIGGANAHVILESAASFGVPPSRTPNASPDLRLLVFSAKHNDSHQRLLSQYKDYLQRKCSNLYDLAYTLGCRREHLEYRSFQVTDGTKPLEVFEPTKVKSSSFEKIFIFTGQGAQWAMMGRELMDKHESFKFDIHLMDNILQSLEHRPSWRIEDELLQAGDSSNLCKAEYSQPLVSAIQIALVNLLGKWAIFPDAVVGHSSGEIAAAYACGALTMRGAIITAFYRGYITKDARGGSMAAIGLSQAEVLESLEPGVVIACENSPQSVTISGDNEPLERIMQSLKKRHPDALVRKLQVNMAYHSHHMKDFGATYQKLIEPFISSQRPNLPLFSSVKGEAIVDSGLLGAAYWRENLESPVLFYTAVKAILDLPESKSKLFLEVGPHSALAGPLRQICKSSAVRDYNYVPTLVRGQDCHASLLTTAGVLYTLGVGCNFAAINPPGEVLTDLPIYPWHHDAEYWAESRLCREWRLRKYPPHDILGSRIAEGNDLEPTWRNILSLDAVPWIRDHKLHDDVVFPFAGYVAMAGAAISQLTNSTDDFTLRHVLVKTALVLQESSRIEMMTILRPVRLTDTLDSSWYEFSILSSNGTTWTKHCTGEVKVDAEHESEHTTLPSALIRAVPSSKWYQAMKKVGLNYGPAFQGLRDITSGTIDSVAVADFKNETTKGESFYHMHPTAVDVCLQLFSVAASRGLPRSLRQMSVPVYVESLYIRSRGIGDLHTYNQVSSAIRGSIVGKAVAVSGEKVFLEMKGLKLTALEETDGLPDLDPLAGGRIHFKPDIDFIDPQTLIKPAGSKKDMALLLERFTVLCMIETNHQIKHLESPVDHLRKYRSWLAQQTDLAKDSKYPLIEEAQTFASLESADRCSLITTMAEEMKVLEGAPVAAAVMRVFETFIDMFIGQTDPLNIFFEGDSLTELYTAFSALWDHRKFFELLTHSKPDLKILELGAGTGGTTALVLDYMKSPYGERMYSSYTYTDISSGFLMKAKERFSYAGGMEYKILDISKDPVEQGFDAEGYDLVIATNVLHATPNLAQSLRNVRKVMQPSGRLFLQELCPIMQLFNYIMGIFPGWWLGEEDGRIEQPYISPDRWSQELTNTGFDGLESVVYDHTHPYEIMATMTARPVLKPKIKSKVTLLRAANGPVEIISQLERVFANAGYEVTLTTLGNNFIQGQDVLSLLDLGGPFFESIAKEDFLAFKDFVSKMTIERILHITKAIHIQCRDPRYAPVLGLARTIRSELSVGFATCEMEDLETNIAENIFKVFRKLQLQAERDLLSPEMEFAVSNGEVRTGRFHWSTLEQQYPNQEEDESFVKTLEIGNPGLLQSLQWRQSVKPDELTGEQVEVEMRAVGMNFKDVLIAMGVVPAKPGSLGVEGAGIVRRISPEVKTLQPGHRVMVLESGSFTTLLTTRERVCIKMPDDMTFEAAATMPCVFGTVIHSLIDNKHLQKGETVLIHSACGGVGIAAIQICQMIGATIFATVGSEAKRRYLEENYGIPQHRIFNSRDSSFLTDIMRETNGRGVDAVLNSLSGELLHASWQCVAEFGMMLEIGKRDFLGRGKLSMDLFEDNRSFLGVDCAQICRERPDIVQGMLTRSVAWYFKGSIRPLEPMVCFEATKIEECFRYMQKGQHIGKIIVTMPENPLNLTLTPGSQRLVLRSDRAVLLVGGLGGLGKAVSTWLVENGARHLIYLGRSAGQSQSDLAFVEELKSMGCSSQVFQGNVNNLEDVKRAIAEAVLPIGGVLQMSMVLKDQAWRQMSHENWQAALSPKVDGTWNLHNALIDVPLDFFVLFSSFSGIVGQWGQANYASANTFLDAFVQYRHSLGLPASSLDIGAIEDVGFVSQNPIILEQFRATGNPLLSQNDLLDVLQLAIVRSDPPSAVSMDDFNNPNQIMQGLKSTVPLSDPNNRTIWKHDVRMSLYRNLETSVDITSTAGNEALKQFLSTVVSDVKVLDNTDSLNFLAKEIGARLQDLLLRPSDEVDVNANLATMGVDSLVSIEIKNWWKRTLGLEITVLDIISSGTVMNLAEGAVKGLKLKYGGSAAANDDGGENKPSDTRIDEVLQMKAP